MDSLIKLILCATLILFVNCNDLEEVTVHLELLEMDLTDHCSNLSLATRDILLRKPNAYKHKFEVQKKFSQFSKKESEDLKTMYHISGLNLPESYKYRWNILEKMGDSELTEEEWAKLTKFTLETEQITNEFQIPCDKLPCDKLPCSLNRTAGCKYSRSDVAQMLKKSHDPNYLRAVWSSAQDNFLSKGKYYPDVLKLAEQAAKANGFDSTEEYWSNLVEYPDDVYVLARNLWSEIEPFYKKLNDFIRTRLEQLYKLPNEDTIPVYLLGSEQGLDLTLIADKLLPHRYLYDELNASLYHEAIGGKKAYELADKLTVNLGLKKIDQKFWKRSIFNASCPSQLLLYCADKYSQVITCNHTGFSEFMNAHEDMMQASLNQIDYSMSIYHKFRFSVIDEAMSQLTTILAMKNLLTNGLLPEEVILASEETHQSKMTALLLSALRIFPRLSYYFLADEFRINALKNPNEDLVGQWWEYRKKYQMVSGVNGKEWDLLGDRYMTSNKPYIGKFLGTILQFQILDHFSNNGDNHVNILSRMSKDKSFKGLVKNRNNNNWLSLLQDEFGIYDIQTDSLLEYFRDLTTYMDKAPLKQVTQTLLPRTTTTVAPRTTSTTTQAPKIEPKVPKVANIQKPEKDVEVKKPTKNTVEETPEVEESSMNKAALVGALIGVISLLIIAGIVGKKRCQRPRTNNRRFEA